MRPRELFSPAATVPLLDLLIYAARVDRRVELSEVDAILGATSFLRPTTTLPDLLLALTGEPPADLPPGLSHLSMGERHLAYALAAWIVEADGIETRDELAFLDHLRSRLGLETTVSERLLAMVRWLRARRPPHLPSSRELEVVLAETLNVLLNIEASWPPRRDPFRRHRLAQN